MIREFIERVCEYEGKYINLCWNSIKRTYRDYGCAFVDKNPDTIMGYINSLDTDWYLKCHNDAGYYMLAMDIDHDDPIALHQKPDYYMWTSLGHRQLLWLLPKQISRAEWETEQTRLVKHYNADRNSALYHFFPRIPFTYNYKRNFQMVSEYD